MNPTAHSHRVPAVLSAELAEHVQSAADVDLNASVVAPIGQASHCAALDAPENVPSGHDIQTPPCARVPGGQLHSSTPPT